MYRIPEAAGVFFAVALESKPGRTHELNINPCDPNHAYLRRKHRSGFYDLPLVSNLSYNVMITCEWHQLVYLAIITANKMTLPPQFRCVSPYVLATKAKMLIFGQRTTPKITLIYRQFLIQIFVQKIKSPHLQKTSSSDLGI